MTARKNKGSEWVVGTNDVGQATLNWKHDASDRQAESDPFERTHDFLRDLEVDGMSVELPADKKSVKVEIKASGYRSVDKKIDLAGGDTAIEFEMAKRSSGTPGVKPPKRPDKPPSGGAGGGLIDI